MADKKNKSYFWASYADMMTSLFFVMLMLFVVAVVQLNRKNIEVNIEKEDLQAKLEKAQEIEDATKNLDHTYFEYINDYKKHKLRVDVHFPVGQSDIGQYVSEETKETLLAAGDSARAFIRRTTEKYPGIQYILIIEGQASRDNYGRNYELSYERALALKCFWENNGIDFTAKNCEVLICGSGDGTQSGTGLMREPDEQLNQRFLIHILPKPGIIQQMSNDSLNKGA